MDHLKTQTVSTGIIQPEESDKTLPEPEVELEIVNSLNAYSV